MARLLSRIQPTPICLAIWAGLAAPAVMAQTAPAKPEKTEEVVISGSRIKRDTFTTPAPLQIIRNDDAALAGFSSTAEVLQGTSVTGGQGQINNAYGGYVTDGGPGANTIGLRGFSPTRSLVLLNGRRIAPSGTRGAVGAADLNVLPDAMVDRIEVLKDGASSIYGSDAIAGVINIITKRNVTGLTAQLKMNKPAGGGESGRFSLVGGFVTDRSRFSGSYEYFERRSLTLGDRDWATCNTDLRRTSAGGVVGDWGSGDFVDPLTGQPKCYPITTTGSNGVTINTLGTSSTTGVGAAGSVGTSFNRWRPNAGITTGLVGFEGVGGGTNNLNVRDTFDPRTLNRSLISPASIHNVYLQGGVDLNALGDAELYYEFMFNRRESSQTGYRQLSLDYSRGSPLIPTNLAFSNFSGPTLITNGNRVGVRAFIGFGNDHSEQSGDFVRSMVGLRGSLLKTGWEYDVNAMTTQARGKYTFDTFLTDRLAQSLNVVASGSGFACVDPSNGCVAAPALSSAVIGGVLPKNWVDYIWRPVTGLTKYRENIVSATATGTLFTMPYGKAKAALGVEHRSYSIDDTPSTDAQIGNLYNFTSSTPTRGSDNVTDVYGEVEVPLLANLVGAHELTASASARWSNYKSYGSGSTYKLGALWSPAKWLTVRGTKSTSFRAPALYEQYLGATSGFIASTNDPCNNWDSVSLAGTARAANCASEGLPAGYTATSSVAVINAGGAAAGLKAETSKNTTFGLVFQPTLGAGSGDLSLAVDYFNIEVNNGVARAGAGEILSRCYNDRDFRAGGGFCRLIDPRNPSSNALTVYDSYVNLSTDVVSGFDYTARYTNNVGIGKLRMNLTLTEYRKQANKLFAEDALDDVNGIVGAPKWSGNLDVYYDVKSWRFYYGLNYIGKMSSYAYYEEDPATSTYKMSVPSYFTHTASVKYSGDKWSATVGVANLTNAKLPTVSSGFVNRVGNTPLYSGYDYVGRTLFANVSKSF